LAKLETEHVFTGSIDQVFQGIVQYPKYPQYLPGVTDIEILPADKPGSSCQVRYELNIIKTFYYVLDMYEESPSRVWWQLADSNVMKENNGSWTLSKKGKDKTAAVYTLDIKFKGLVPSTITSKVAKANIPGMLEGFQKLIDECKS
jgi:ribosome-associated toxin RatA of RatAB toxin-antitoxin module